MSSSTSTTRSVVEEFYRRLAAGETATMPDLFADTVDWNVYGSETVPWVGRRSTRAEVAEFFKTFPGHVQTEDFTIAHILADGPHAVVIGHMRHLIRATGKPFDSPFAFQFTVEDGLITGYVAHEDSLALARAFETP